jgi:site-specific DNA recombinase
MRPPTAALYVRISQDDEGGSTARQEYEARAWCAREGLEVVAVHRDEGISAYHLRERPGWEEARAGLRSGAFGALVVWKLDRASRKGAGEVLALMEEAKAAGGRFVSLQDGVDTDAPESTVRLLAALLAEVGRAESAGISLRVKAAERHAKREGRWVWGRPPWGLRRTAEGRLEPDPETAEVARAVVRRLGAGEPLVAEARRLNAEGVAPPKGKEWRASSLASWLRNTALVGLMPDAKGQGERGRPFRHPDTGETVTVGSPLVTPEELAAARASVASRRTPGQGWGASRGKRPARRWLLDSGLARCSLCGGPMVMSGPGYACSLHARGGPCPGVFVRAQAADAIVGEAVLRRLAALEPDDPSLALAAERWRGEQPEEGEERAGLRAALEDRKAEVRRARALYVRGDYEGDEGAYGDLVGALRAEVGRLEAALAALPTPEPEGVLSALLEPEVAREAWGVASLGDRRAVVRAVVDRVEVLPSRGYGPVGPERLVIRWAEV